MPETEVVAPVVPVTPPIEAPAELPIEAPPATVSPAADIPVEPAPTGDWPEDWRTKYSQDPKVLKQLERYGSPNAALDALFNAQKKIAEKGTRLKENATPEELAAWRTENGLPDTPEGYDLGTLPNGVVIGEADKPLVDDFLAVAHARNMNPDQVRQAVGWFFDRSTKAAAELAKQDAAAHDANIASLVQEFGADYGRNLAIAHDVLVNSPVGDIKDEVLTGRLANGTLFGDDPRVIRWLVGIGRELNPVTTVVPGAGMNTLQAIASELITIKSLMGDSASKYWKGPEAAALQARYRELIDAQSKGKR